MPTQSSFGAKTNADREELFVQLKGKGEKITFRVIKPPKYDGKHFSKDPNGKFTVEECPAIMTKEYCEKCDTYYKTLREVKKLKAEKADAEAKALEESVKHLKNKVTYYYPIINREKESVQILKTTTSIRIKIDQEASMGIDVTKFDYVMVRTETPGSDYYTLTRIDSSMSKPLSEKEKVEWEKGQTILDRLDNRRESTQELGNSMVDAIVGDSEQEPYTPPNPADEPPTIKVYPQSGEVVNPEDIPF